MYTNITKNLKKIISEISNLNQYTKIVLKIGFQIFLALLTIGTAFVVINKTGSNYNLQVGFTANSIIKASFTVLAEIVIGSLIIDYIFHK